MDTNRMSLFWYTSFMTSCMRPLILVRSSEAEGYRLYILSDNPKQFDRLREIFADRFMRSRAMSLSLLLVRSFIFCQAPEPMRLVCVFTDHQIFDRFHKYTLKSERARSGKMALSLKELGQIEPGTGGILRPRSV